jgi:hypothetical protein
MKLFRALPLLLLALMPAVLHAQATIPVSGTQIKDSSNNLLTGQLVFTVTDATGAPVTYTVSGGSPSTASITIPTVNGVVQNVGGLPARIPNPLTMTPANTRYDIKVQTTGGSITYFDLPLTNIAQPFFSYDSYAVQASNDVVGIVTNGGQQHIARNFELGRWTNGNFGSGQQRPWNYSYVADQRFPGGGSIEAIARNVDMQGGFMHSWSELALEVDNVTVRTMGQIGGMKGGIYTQSGTGDFVIESTHHFSSGCTRQTDECFEHYRNESGFLNPNWGGHLTKGTRLASGDVPITMTPFGGYKPDFSSEGALLYDVTRRQSKGNLVAVAPASIGRGAFIQATIPSHGYAVSNFTTLVDGIDSNVKTGTCPTLTNTGTTYPTIGPNQNSSDGFQTPVSGLGVPQVNANFVNAPHGALVGYCVHVASTANMHPGDRVVFYSTEGGQTEIDTVIAVPDSTHFTAYLHSFIDLWVGTSVSWDTKGTPDAQRSIGRAMGFNADELPAHSQDGGLGGNPQQVVNRTVYPYAGCIDSNNCLVWVDAGGGTQELKTRGYGMNTTPGLAVGVTFSVSGGVVISVTGNNNNPQENNGASLITPMPAYTITGCTVAPVLKFTLQIYVNHMSWQPSLVSGGSGCGTPVFTPTTFPNPVYDVPMTWVVRDVDPNNCSTNPPYACSASDGYALVNPWIIGSVVNGDEIAQGSWWNRYGGADGGYKLDYADDIIQNSGRSGVSPLLDAIKDVKNGEAFRYYTDLTATTKEFGTNATGWQPDPATPGSGSKNPTPWLRLGGHLDTTIYELPPMGNSVQGSGPVSSQPGAPNIGGYLNIVGCVLGPFAAGQVDDPCLHGVYPAIGLYNFAYGAGGSLTYDPYSGELQWSKGMSIGGAKRLNGNANAGSSKLLEVGSSAQFTVDASGNVAAVAGTFSIYQTATNCASSASPAVCAAAPAGAVVIPVGETSVTVNTTAVTANSEIRVTPDASLGARLGVTCNSTAATAFAGFGVSARTPGISFTISTTGTVATNPACYSYTIVN